jgi:hypothetical protein
VSAMPRGTRGLSWVVPAAVLVVQTAGFAQSNHAPGNGTIYIGTYAGKIEVFDEATATVIGELPFTKGIPARITLSDDKARIYATDSTWEHVELIDRVNRRSIDAFTLSEGSAKTRIWGLQPDPTDQYVVLLFKKYELKTDRWEVGPPTLVQYDLASKSITRTIPWPKGEEREGVGILFSPDGKLMYLLGPEIVALETTGFTEVDRWDLSRPYESGAGRVNLGGLEPTGDAPGFYTGLFTMQDPLQGRRIMGIGRIDLGGKKIEFHPIGPAQGLRFAMAPDRKRGYGLVQDIGEYEYWTFDLENYRLLSRERFAGRPRMGLTVSSSGNLVYIHTAGNTIDVYEASTFRHVRTIELDGDMTSFTMVRPSAGR